MNDLEFAEGCVRMARLPGAKELAKRYTIRVRIEQWEEWNWRLEIGTWLICLAARIMWMEVEFVMEEQNEHKD